MYHEIIADSEGEDELFGPIAPAPVVGPKTTTPSAASTSANVSTISEFSTSKATAIDSISNFSSTASHAHAASTIITTATATTSRPRPKPKPLTRNIGHTSAISSGNSSNNASTGNASHIEMFDMTLSIADRAKMRKRNKDGNHTSSSSGALAQLDILEISSDDELALLPANKPKKSKKTAEKNTTKKSSSLTTAATTSNHMRYDSPDPDPNHSSSFSLPVVATSPALARNGIRASSIMLPPSDPPQSTPSEDFDIPAIETLPNPPSSASASAVSESFVLRAHRDLTDSNIPPTPAPFFADPSSSPFPIDNNPNIPDKNFNNTNSIEIHTTRVMDSVLMPPPPGPSPIVQPEAKNSRTKKKKVNDDEDEYMIDGEEWTGTEPKGKGKKSKSKAKVNDKDKTATSKDKVKSTKSSTKAKGKGKEKEVQVVSKSREFIEDDGEIDEMLMSTITVPPRNTSIGSSPAPQTYVQPQRSSPGGKRARDASDGQGDDFDDVNEVLGQGTRKKMRKSDDKDEARDAFGAADGVVDLSGGLDLDVDIGQSTSSRSSLRKGKKGKKGRVVMSEDEDEDAVSDMYMEDQGRNAFDMVSITTTKPKTKPKSNAKKRVVSGDEEEGHVTAAEDIGSLKENILPSRPDIPQTPISRTHMASGSSIQATPDTLAPDQKDLRYPSLTSRYTIAPKSARKSTPMSDLIRRVNSMPNSQFKSPMPKGGNRSGGGNNTPISLTAYSPYLKSSRSFLSRIAPLHPNRRTPPPLPPAPPPRKKTRKEIEWEKKDKEEREEMEERWEEELVERVGGMGEWLGMTEDMRKMMKRAKRDRELGLGGWEE
ncbi:hypothetical protein LENED_001091 [Lentinula edodes]|uniref:Uncharacterized protein n=1 Tax=Lentinula edodes TaxID=5353 RepID=A0A1Q3DX93_LENED|nr:hypothetical protein LENED_001091 [Lentinula edodes]